MSPSPKRLTTSDLIVYGIVLIQPIAPVGIFGIANRVSNGFVTTSILLAMVAMSITALSYGRLAALHPSAGSAYTYVGRSFNPLAGYMVGWAMLLDYLIIPVISTIYAALTLERLLPTIPFLDWCFLFVLTITILNLAGVRSLARANQVMLFVMTIVVAAFILLSINFLLRNSGWKGVISSRPFYDAATFHWKAVMTATSLAALTYIGFDGVTTLAEEVRNPKRSVPLATVLVCLLAGAFSAAEVYLAQRVWPNYHTFQNLETAFLDVTRVVGGNLLFQAVGLVLVIASLGSGLTGQAAAARLLYVMGRDNAMPKQIFGRWDTRRAQPSLNILLIGLLSLLGALLMSYESTAELLNFGAFLAFMGVNLAAIKTFWFEKANRSHNWLTDVLLPFAGFTFCFTIWWSLPMPAKIAGAVWFCIGLAQIFVQTRGFRKPLASISFGEA